MIPNEHRSRVWHSGRCHCGAVRFSALAPPALTAESCNCSICAKTAFLHLIVPFEALRIEAGREHLLAYRFNTGTALHWFCASCAVKPFYVPRSNPDGYSVNVRCLDRSTIESLTVRTFDGRNWEANAARLVHLSRS